MNPAALIDAFELPRAARVERRVPKKMLTEHGAPTAADRRRLLEGIEELTWVAVLKPTNIGVPAFRDATREYLEIAVVAATLRPPPARPGAPARAHKDIPERTLALIHRAIPYPVVLAAEQAGHLCLSAGHKRWSQGEGGKTVVEGLRVAEIGADAPPPEPEVQREFLLSLAVSRLPSANLFALYDGLLHRMMAFKAARITGRFMSPADAGKAAALAEVLEKRATAERRLVALRAQARREKQVNRRVEINLEIQRIESDLGRSIVALGGSTSEEPNRIH